MCCFSGPIELVANTKIFARVEADRQFLAYEMRAVTSHAVAMVLPLPTDLTTRQLDWIDLSHADGFFQDIDTSLAYMPNDGEDDLFGESH